MEYNIMTEDKFKFKIYHFTVQQLQLCKEIDVDLEQERKAFIQMASGYNKTRKNLQWHLLIGYIKIIRYIFPSCREKCFRKRHFKKRIRTI